MLVLAFYVLSSALFLYCLIIMLLQVRCMCVTQLRLHIPVLGYHMGTKRLRNKTTKERIVQGTNRPRNKSSKEGIIQGTKHRRKNRSKFAFRSRE